MTRYVLGLDVGTQSAKVQIYAEDGRLAAQASRPLRPLVIPAPNRAEHPDDDLWTATRAVLRDAATAFVAQGHDVADITAMGICVIRCCRVLLGHDGSLAHPVLSWMDERLDHPHDPDNPVGDVAHVTTSSGYIGFRLTGERVDTCANLIGWWPIDDRELDWSPDPERWAACNLTRDLVFDLVHPGEQLGRLRHDVAVDVGLPAGLPVIATAHDKAVEALGAGVLQPGTALVSLGTYIAAMTVGETFIGDTSSFWTFQASLPGHYLHECWGVRRGMWTVSWFRDHLGLGVVTGASTDDPEVLEELLDREAAQVPAGSEGLLTVHDWAAPPHAPFRKGAIVGLDGRHTRAHLYRSLLEGIALRLRTHMTPMAAALGEPFTDVVVSGGGANSDLLLQILADVLGVPATRNRVRSSAAIGCVINAGMATGVFTTPEQAVARLVQRDDIVQPIADHAAVYERLAAVEAGVHAHLDPLNRALANLRG